MHHIHKMLQILLTQLQLQIQFLIIWQQAQDTPMSVGLILMKLEIFKCIQDGFKAFLGFVMLLSLMVLKVNGEFMNGELTVNIVSLITLVKEEEQQHVFQI